MNETTSRALLYGLALTVLGGIAALWATTDNEADVMVLLNSAEVQLQAAYMTPATDLDGDALTARAELLRRGALEEAVIGVAQAAAAALEGRLVAFNAVRGVYRIELVEGASRL